MELTSRITGRILLFLVLSAGTRHDSDRNIRSYVKTEGNFVRW